MKGKIYLFHVERFDRDKVKKMTVRQVEAAKYDAAWSFDSAAGLQNLFNEQILDGVGNFWVRIIETI
jgi:hypothetical protein